MKLGLVLLGLAVDCGEDSLVVLYTTYRINGDIKSLVGVDDVSCNIMEMNEVWLKGL